MPFPLDVKFVDEAQNELNVIFPKVFVQKMLEENGGEVSTEDDDWTLYPILDKTDNKRISRTCNHIGLETQKAKEWATFPETAIAIGTNGYGDQLILLPDKAENRKFQEAIYVWQHETGETTKVADNILELFDI
ncbi:SMI1/KNR4 family protein [Mucilaginibacter arboris]|uniref:SMI1/KNR4 family protein n=1 Tax=Mucilaginibacter arboris TaxID=2682090 RepID=A0A7K1T2L8_9SPHI|nr:SMI1/KNR4 family protein [Mucilaginibacter arboris]MVN23560.1 SMI1/KNR4 family protein [Mucilaginibacter arboris]